ncbi:MAG: vanadium-dependent haloperoxidase [Pirellulales bacterium]
MIGWWKTSLTMACILLLNGSLASAQSSVARQWDDELLSAIRIDTPRPTVHARNLFHTSVAMYDAWAAYDPVAAGYLTHEKLAAGDVAAARNEAISFAAYRILSTRFANSPGNATILPALDARMSLLGYDKTNTSTVGDSPAAVGNRIAAAVLAYGLNDGSNEAGNYADTTGYVAGNAPLDVSQPSTTMASPNQWQPLKIGSNTQKFLTPQWGDVASFGMTKTNPNDIYHDPGAPPLMGTATDVQFRQEFVDVIRYSSLLSPVGGATIDISPGAVGNNSLGSNSGTGHAVNPATGLPYAPNLVNQGDFGRVMAEFWADGPHSETPPGHWNLIFNDASESPLLKKKIGGTGPVVDNLEWDVKGYLALNGALHNAAITAWDVKEAYDCVRPISAIRYMGSQGQSSDPGGPSYSPDGLPLEAGLIEVITAETTAPGQRHAALAGNEGKIAIMGWLGHPADPQNDIGGTGWMLAEDWLPYQRDTFVTPAFPGFISGHSTFSRAGAEVLTALTGSEFFPGGLMEYDLPAGSYLTFEDGPSQDVDLQYATYFDAADAAGQSRLWGGIHVLSDDFAGRIAGSAIGKEAWAYANDYFTGQVPEPSAGLLALLGLLPVIRRRARTVR